MRLVTIPFSHYCEKARWAADLSGVPYHEAAYLPGPHLLPMRRAGGRTVPVLVSDDGVYADSTTIVRYFAARSPGLLFPAGAEERAQVERFEADFDHGLGRGARAVVYHYLLPDLARMASLLGESAGQRLALRVLLPLVRPLMRRRYRLTPSSLPANLARVRDAFTTVSTALSDDPARYLVGGHFSAADLTFAALASPLLLPPEHPRFRVDIARLPAPLAALVTELRQTPAGAFAARIYREHRSVTAT